MHSQQQTIPLPSRLNSSTLFENKIRKPLVKQTLNRTSEKCQVKTDLAASPRNDAGSFLTCFGVNANPKLCQQSTKKKKATSSSTTTTHCDVRAAPLRQPDVTKRT
jgi:hypothetical protein